MTQTGSSDRRRRSFIATVLLIGIVSLLQPGCDCGSSGTFTPAIVASVFPEQSSDTALVSTDVVAFFGRDMDETTIDETTFTLTEVGGAQVTAIVSYDAITRSATLVPVTDLISGTQYTATISATVQDSTGNTPLTSNFSWSFTISPSMLLVSKNSLGTTANNNSRFADISSDGRYTVFQSTATNLVSNVTVNGLDQVYRKDNLTGEVLLASSDSTGLIASNRAAINARISTNGRFIVFESNATNLDPLINSNGIIQIYLKDMDDGSIVIASRDVLGFADNSANTAANARVSDDGRFVVFQSADVNLSPIDGAGNIQIYLKDLTDESVDMISRTGTAAGNGDSINPDINPDGSLIVFESIAPNLSLTTNDRHIYFVDTTITHAIEQISVSTVGAGANGPSANPSISDDGSIVVFDSNADNLDALVNDPNLNADIYRRDRLTPLTNLISANPATGDSANGISTNPDINGTGDYVVFRSNADDLDGGTTGVFNIFVRDLSVSPPIIDIVRVNLPVSGSASTSDSQNPAISSDGRYTSFDSFEGYTLDGTDIFLDVFRAHNSTFQ